jgi:hypothetical protein
MRGFEFQLLKVRICCLIVNRSKLVQVALKSQRMLTVLLRLLRKTRVKLLADFVATHFCL